MTDGDCDRQATRLALPLILAWVLVWSSLAAVLRALWLDESFSILRAQGSLADVLELNRHVEVSNPPLYPVLIHFWLVLGDSALVVRSLSILSALGATGLVFAMGRMLVDARTGTAAAAVFAISNVQFYYAHEARAYMLVVMLSLAASFLMLRYVLQPSATPRAKGGLLAGYCVFTLASGYAHYYAWLNVAAQFLALGALVAASSGETRRQFFHRTLALLAAGLCALALYIPEIFALVDKATISLGVIEGAEFLSGAHQIQTGLGSQDWLNRWLAFASGFQWTPFNHAWFGRVCAAVAIGLILSTLFGLLRQLRTSERSKQTAVLVGGMAVFPWLLLVLVPSAHRFECKHLLFALPWFCLALALPAVTARRGLNLAWLPLGVFAVFNLYASVQMLATEKEDWPAAWELISEQSRPGDLLLVSPSYLHVPLARNRTERAPRLQPLTTRDPAEPAVFSILAPGAERQRMPHRSPEDWMRQAAARGQRVFVLRGWSNVSVPDPELQGVLKKQGLVLKDYVKLFPGGAGSSATMLIVGRYGARKG